jgi:hypothetical protein
MFARDEELKAIHWGIHPQVERRGVVGVTVLVALAARTAAAVADPTTAVVPDPPPAPHRVHVAPAQFAPSWDLDGFYVWLGPLGAASYVDAKWDSTFGGELAIGTVRERAPIAMVGLDLGASRWTARDGGRVWVDGLIGTRWLGRMMGASLGPILELSQLAHPHLGGSVGVWGFAGITPFARVGAVAELGMFAEIGIHVALPVLHR